MHLGDSEQHLNGLTVMHQCGDNDTAMLESECQVSVQKVRVMLFFPPQILKGLKTEHGGGTRGIFRLNLNEILDL